MRLHGSPVLPVAIAATMLASSPAATPPRTEPSPRPLALEQRISARIAVERVVTPEILNRIHTEVRSHEFLMKGFDGPVFAKFLGGDDFIANSRQWDVVWPDGDLWKGGLMTQGLYVSPSRDLVICYFSVNNDDHTGHRYARPIAVSGLFDKA